MNTANMKTVIFKNNIEDIRKAADIIKRGGLVAFPTETVYGLGANALNPGAVAGIFAAKGRPADNPLIVHIADPGQCEQLTTHISQTASLLMDRFWPGPLTLILPAGPYIPSITTGDLDTIGIRIPSHPTALKLLRLSGTPIAAPSANTSGRPSPTTASHVQKDLEGKIDAIIDGGPVEIGVESTVLDVTGDIPIILRPGHITASQIEQYCGRVLIGYEDSTLEDTEKVRSPGMKYTHYSPGTPVVLIEGSPDFVINNSRDLIKKEHDLKHRAGLLICNENLKQISADETYSLGDRTKPARVAQNLFMGLRYLDMQQIDLIIVDGSFVNRGIGTAVFNRVRKAAQRIIKEV